MYFIKKTFSDLGIGRWGCFDVNSGFSWSHLNSFLGRFAFHSDGLFTPIEGESVDHPIDRGSDVLESLSRRGVQKANGQANE